LTQKDNNFVVLRWLVPKMGITISRFNFKVCGGYCVVFCGVWGGAYGGAYGLACGAYGGPCSGYCGGVCVGAYDLAYYGALFLWYRLLLSHSLSQIMIMISVVYASSIVKNLDVSIGGGLVVDSDS